MEHPMNYTRYLYTLGVKDKFVNPIIALPYLLCLLFLLKTFCHVLVCLLLLDISIRLSERGTFKYFHTQTLKEETLVVT